MPFFSPLMAANAVSLSQKLNKIIAGGSQDYGSWRSLILEIETASPEDIKTLSLAYDTFLSIFPLCHWHLEKYAHHKAKLCSPQEAIDIFERGASVATFSVGFWADYFSFTAACSRNPEDVHRLFRRAISFVEKDYFCHVLWDKYMKYEFNQEGWSFLAQSYIQALRFPTKKLHFYYDNFKQFVANLEEEMGCESNSSIAGQLSVPCATEISRDEISLVIKDLLESSDKSIKSKALDRYRSIGEGLYQKACQLDEKIKGFETRIRRRYFYVTPLEDEQLNNWHLYLDFIEKQDNLDWAVKLYERCLIPCANYSEFWMRYVEFLESKSGRELAISALDRATQIFLKNMPEIHLFNARFREHVGDVSGARAALTHSDTKMDSSYIENVVTLANLERRLGNVAAASATYEKALKTAREKQNLHVLPNLYSHFARLTFLITGNASAARDVLIEGVRNVPHRRFLLEELIKFAMTHEGASQVNIVDSIIDDFISPGLDECKSMNFKDREDISCLFLEFVNLCGSVLDIRKAWNRHIKLFPQSLRMRTTHKHCTLGSKYMMDMARDQNGNNDHDQRQEEVVEFQTNQENPNNQKARSNNAKKAVQLLFTEEALRPLNEDASRENQGLACHSCGPMVVSSAELDADLTKENASSAHDLDQGLSYQSRGGEEQGGPMYVSTELAEQSKGNALSTHEPDLEVGKLTGTISHSSLMLVQPEEANHEFRQQKHPANLDTISLKSREKDSPEMIPMSSNQEEAKRGVPKDHNESGRDGSVTHQHSTPKRMHTNPKELSHIGEESIERAMKRRSQLESGAAREDRETEEERPMSAGQPPLSSSYPSQQNTDQMSSLNSQDPWQGQQSLAMNQMLQYQYYQQQQLLQQQQQNNPYYQLQYGYMNHQQQAYQVQPHQQVQEPQLDSQQGNEKQYNQSQELAYQAYQQQMLMWQQYQQYHQYMQHQQHPSQEQQDESTPSTKTITATQGKG